MSRQAKKSWVLFLIVATSLTGCHPTQPFYCLEDGDLSHMLETATERDYPDVDQAQLPEVVGARPPLTIANCKFDEPWKVSLEEAICIALKNSKVMRTFGVGSSQGRLADLRPDRLIGSPTSVPTVFDPAITESNPGGIGLGTGTTVPGVSGSIPNAPGRITTNGEPGVEAALAAFDTRLSAGMFWERTNRAQNFGGAIADFFSTVGDDANFDVQLSKRAATGTELFLRTGAVYAESNASSRRQPSDWLANLEMEVRQPLLRGAGTQVNRMNVMLARINTDMSLADFEAGARNLVTDVERAYWELYYHYRLLEAQKVARDAALKLWQNVKTKQIVSVEGGEAAKEAQAREEYFRRRGEVEKAFRDLFKVENRLRYIMGLAATDGRLILPTDEPTTAKVTFDWHEIHAEALCRSVELRKQKWMLKRREMELITARNGLLPRLDAVGLYRWLGRGDDLIEANRKGINFPGDGSLAWDELTEGNFAEWGLGFTFEMPLGFRQELAGVRWAQLALAREKARLEEMELELSHLLTIAIQDLDAWYALVQTNYNWRVAAQKEVEAVDQAVIFGKATVDLLLRAQQSQADAEIAYYEALRFYNMAVVDVHFRKGSLLEYNGVCLAEGPWPAKAYFDAHSHARRRDASYYLDYGVTRPKVVSRGPVEQNLQPGMITSESEVIEGELPVEAEVPVEAEGAEEIESLQPPMPEPVPADAAVDSRPLRAPAKTGTQSSGPVLMPAQLPSTPGSSIR